MGRRRRGRGGPLVTIGLWPASAGGPLVGTGGKGFWLPPQKPWRGDAVATGGGRANIVQKLLL